uniref:Secreted protein n=1 Tax=Zea mays TaxID=4577 RepID=B6UDU7_MAIZE|nr:hypothetical protein [Zea mays]
MKVLVVAVLALVAAAAAAAAAAGQGEEGGGPPLPFAVGAAPAGCDVAQPAGEGHRVGVAPSPNAQLMSAPALVGKRHVSLQQGQ